MPLLFKIYIYCCIGSFLYIVLINTMIKRLIKEEKHNIYLNTAYELWNNGSVLYQFISIFLPIINAVFSILALILIIGRIRYWITTKWNDLGYWIVGEFIKNHKHTKLKLFIVKNFFKPYLKTFNLHIIFRWRTMD